MSIPKIIFIIPYRNRENQKSLFIRQMRYVLEDINPEDYKIYFSEQCDNRDFNRGAIKNIGFLAMKIKYPNDYKKITFVFNDVDTMPYRKNYLNYETSENNIKHFFGYTFTLGGIVSILGSDFEKLQGYPNLWTWGYEDNMLQIRANRNGINIDRGQFHPMLSNEIMQLTDDVLKQVNKNEFERYMENKDDGVHTIQSLEYSIDENNNTIRITNFKTPFSNISNTNSIFDIRSKNNKPFTYEKNKKGGRFNVGMKMIF
jgi:hypothetical protein